MDNTVQIFDNPEFGKVRVVIIDGNPWFVANDVARVLKLTNIRQNLANLDDDEKGVYNVYSPGGGIKEMNIVNEPGLYHLIFTSRMPEAKKFRRWVYHEVLPSIRKTGSYSVDASKRPSTPNAWELGNALKQLSSHSRDPFTLEKLVNEAAKLLTGEEGFDNPFYEPDKQSPEKATAPIEPDEPFWTPSFRLSPTRRGRPRE